MTTAIVERHLAFRGGNLAAYNAHDPEILLEGPAGTGKTMTVLCKLHDLCSDHPGLRGLIVRKVAATLGGTVLPTLEEEVFEGWDANERRSLLDGVHYFGGSEREAAAYVYDNGSRIVIGGMDQASKVLGSFYDVIFFNQAEEATVEDIETMKTRLRHGLIPDNRLYCDANPSHDKHHLILRARSGLMRHFKSTIKDNPRYYYDDGNMTSAGHEYIERHLSGLTGSRYQRLVLGEWVGMENAIYETLERERHLLVPPIGMTWGKSAIGIDYGTVHMSAIVVVREDSSGRTWVRECWTGGEDEQPILDITRSMKVRYNATAGVVDPIPAMQMLANKLAFRRSGQGEKGQRASGEGSRIANVVRVKTMLSNDALRFDLNGEGVEELFSEAQAYRWLHKDSENIEKYVVDRHNDDRVAAMEYAIEALKVPGAIAEGAERIALPYAMPRSTALRKVLGRNV